MTKRSYKLHGTHGLHKDAGRNVALIEFQRSQKTENEHVVFTVNVGILCGELSEEADFRKASVMDAHLWERLGFLLPEANDKWWEITARNECNCPCR